ncbi:hypothetical protein L0222_18935 [bacterium]|nr:hypothetical protein [bacterium]MCI0602621.1 hypothetical protein [bacterium]
MTIDFFGFGNEPSALAIQEDGKIVISGEAYKDEAGTNSTWAIARLFSNGWLDWTFGYNGKITYDWSTYRDFTQSLVIQTDGKIVVSGKVGIPLNFWIGTFLVLRHTRFRICERLPKLQCRIFRERSRGSKWKNYFRRICGQ